MIFEKSENIPLADDFMEEFKKKNRNPLRRALYDYGVREDSHKVIFEIGQKGYEKNLKAFMLLMYYLSTLSDTQLDNYVNKVRKKSMILLARDKNALALKTIFSKMTDEEFELFTKNLKPNIELYRKGMLTNNFTEFLTDDGVADMMYAFNNMQKYLIGLLDFKNETQDFIEKRFNVKLIDYMFYMPTPKKRGESNLCEVPNCRQKATHHVDMADGKLGMCDKHHEAYELAQKMGKLGGSKNE